MADGLGSAEDINAAEPSEGEKAVMAAVPPDASATEEALQSNINNLLGSQFDDPRYKAPEVNDGKDADDTKGDVPGTADKPASEAQRGDGDLKPASETPAKSVEVETPPVVEAKAEVKPVVAEPKDYSLTVVDASGKEWKIEKATDLPEDFMPKNNQQVMQILDDLNVKRTERANDEAQAAKDAADAEATAKDQANQQAQRDQLTAWDAEISQLQKVGKLPEPKLKPGDQGFVDDPAVKAVDEIFGYIVEENTRREKTGQPKLTSFTDAFRNIELTKIEEAQAKAAKDEAETAKLKAGMVGGGSARGGSKVDKPYIAGQAGGDIRNVI